MKEKVKSFEWDRKTCLMCGAPLKKEYVYDGITTIHKFCDACFLEIWPPDHKKEDKGKTMDKKQENYLIDKINNLTININEMRLHLLELKERQGKILELIKDVLINQIQRWEKEQEEEDKD